jgi:hypothetical protein
MTKEIENIGHQPSAVCHGWLVETTTSRVDEGLLHAGPVGTGRIFKRRPFVPVAFQADGIAMARRYLACTSNTADRIPLGIWPITVAVFAPLASRTSTVCLPSRCRTVTRLGFQGPTLWAPYPFHTPLRLSLCTDLRVDLVALPGRGGL